MKAYNTACSAITLFLSWVAVANSADYTPTPSSSCLNPPTPGSCLDTGIVCTLASDKCCAGLFCLGFGFFKKCVEPPTCLREWYDCSSGLKCCDPLKCTATILNNSETVYECKKPEIGTRTIEIPPGGANLVTPTLPPTPLNATPAPAGTPTNPVPTPTEPVPTPTWLSPPTPPPTPPKNLNTTKVPGKPVTRKTACASGDPHITTFDGLKYDCQGVGEHVLVKSLLTQREIQARFEPLNGRAITVGKGLAIQDEGDTPRVQITLASLDDTLGNNVADGCTFLFFVDGEQRDLAAGSGDPRVSVVWKSSSIKVKYNESQLEVSLTFSNSSCRMSYCVSLPDGDNVVGMLGTPNGNIKDEWKTPNGTIIAQPTALADKVKKPGYDFCTTYYCLQDKNKSLFVYPEEGIDFDYFEKCGLPFGVTLDQYLANVSQAVLALCGQDLACIMDVKEGNDDDAILLRSASTMYSDTCNPTGGECDTSKCCGTIPCVDNGGLAGKVCGGNMTCSPEFGNCLQLGCCGNLTCTVQKDGKSMCMDVRTCQAEWMSCKDTGCCSGLLCMDNFKGGKQCRKLPVCMKQWDDCSVVGCCVGLKCYNAPNGGKQCQNRPACWKDQWKDCSETPCCDGLTCIKKSGRDVCARLPACVPIGQSCEWSPCCDDPVNPMQCVDIVDSAGLQGKQCRYAPGLVEVRVFNDVNGNGIQDANEPGVEGVVLNLYDESTKDTLINYQAVTSDVSGIALFQEVPKAKTLRIQVLQAPAGAVPTKSNQGGNDALDSDLASTGILTDSFRLMSATWNNTDIGYLLPLPLEVKVFNDMDSDGIQEDGEIGLSGVKLRLVASTSQISGPDVESDSDGIVRFLNTPQNIKYKVALSEAPYGAIPTKANIGNESSDSDLNADGKSQEFTIFGTQSLPKISFGFRMPETVITRVWNDANYNGLQDDGELGIPGVKVCLVKDDTNKTRLPSQNNGGNAHEDVTSDADGLVVFTKVPQGTALRVKVLEPPRGAMPTLLVGTNPLQNSDLGSNGLSNAFTIAKSGSAFTDIDLGYKFQYSLIVRVWDDSNGNGIQDDGETGIPGVTLRLQDEYSNNLVNQNNGGNAHEEIATTNDGLATFTLVPPNKRCKVKVTNAPPGAAISAKNQGGDDNKDSDLSLDGTSDIFVMDKEGDLTNVALGYKLPTSVVVRVWDDMNGNGLQDDDEGGITNVTLRIVKYIDKSLLPNQNNGGNAHLEIATDETGFATFYGVPKGIVLAVKVTNFPKGATKTAIDQGTDEERDSDLRQDSTSNSFDLGTFAGSKFGQIDLGYLMPEDVQVRVWDDINGNGAQDSTELGIAGVTLRIVTDLGAVIANQGNGGTADQNLTTDESGLVTFTKVPKGVNLKIQVLNQPIGSASTILDAANVTDDADSDLKADGKTSNIFNLLSFAGSGPFSSIDLGYRMPNDMQVRVWDDINGNGIQDAGEPGIKDVRLRLGKSDTACTPLTNIGGGSTAHAELLTDANGTATFLIVPKGVDLKVKVLNAPPGSMSTSQNIGSDDSDSDLKGDLTSDVFNLNSFTTAGAYGAIDLGFRMPKSVVVRAWNDINGNGIQEDSEVGLAGVQLRIVLANGADLPDQLNDGNAHTVLTTGTDGRVTFTKVPQNIYLKVKVIKPPTGTSVTVTRRNACADQLDSDLNANGLTDQFMLPSDVTELYDMVDVGWIVK